MRISVAKKLWWVLLVGGLGGIALFILILFTERPGLSISALFIPGAGLLIAGVSAWCLKKCYREAPLAAGTRWHLSIQDFLALTLFEGLLLSSFKVAIPEHFFNLGIPFALAIAAASIPGALAASAKGIHSPIARPVYASGYAMLLIGGLLSGGLVILLTVVCVGDGISPLRPIRDLLGINGNAYTSWGIVMFRLGLIFLIAGFVACRLARGGREKTAT
jgi:hypothetical protein